MGWKEDGFKSLIWKTSDLAAKNKCLQAPFSKSTEPKSKAERQNKDLIAQVAFSEGRVDTLVATVHRFRVVRNSPFVQYGSLEKSAVDMSSENKLMKQQLDAASVRRCSSNTPLRLNPGKTCQGPYADARHSMWHPRFGEIKLTPISMGPRPALGTTMGNLSPRVMGEIGGPKSLHMPLKNTR